MKQNVGYMDRLLRVGIGNLILYFALLEGQYWGFFGIIPLITGTVGWCPLYRLFGRTTVCKSCVDS